MKNKKNTTRSLRSLESTENTEEEQKKSESKIALLINSNVKYLKAGIQRMKL